jgi:hypothetical protein
MGSRSLPESFTYSVERNQELGAWAQRWAAIMDEVLKPGARLRSTRNCRNSTRYRWLCDDLRRTALPNMIEAGLSGKEAMEIIGHRTRAVFDHYHIVSERRLREMANKIEAH